MKNVGSYPNVRLRRNRKTEWSRRLVSENNLSTNDLIWPIFIKEGKNIKEPVVSMPGVYRYTLDKIENLVEKAINKKIPMIALFPQIPKLKKNANLIIEVPHANNLLLKKLKIKSFINFTLWSEHLILHTRLFLFRASDPLAFFLNFGI